MVALGCNRTYDLARLCFPGVQPLNRFQSDYSNEASPSPARVDLDEVGQSSGDLELERVGDDLAAGSDEVNQNTAPATKNERNPKKLHNDTKNSLVATR